ncbi:hypothetical protein [uncultured Draconibacterium sp.]|uniref:hypothetical protein n=1 Tax=uncultured Draconibacterium sp. TaxID=1573823 RepID=UPI0025DB9AEC|nr:hypothetical protein [uncultured Draconibacterium sp.]
MKRESVGLVTLKRCNGDETVRINLNGQIGHSRNELQDYLKSELEGETELLQATQKRIDRIKKALEISESDDFTATGTTLYPERISTFTYKGEKLENTTGAFWD